MGDKVNLFSPGNLGDRLRMLCGCSVGCSLSRRPVSSFDLSFVTTVTHQTSLSSCVIVIFFNVTEFLSFSFFFNFLVDSVFCLNEDDRRWKTMCTHPLNRNQGDDRLLGMEECRSPFGNYELHIPVDEELSCSDDMPITHLNCRDLDVSYRSCN